MEQMTPGTHLGPYEIVARVRSGGMATLFLARRTGPAGFSVPVAIKVVHPHLATDAKFVEMFLDEARLASRIRHPNVVRVEALGEVGGVYYLAMEFVAGATLAPIIAGLQRAQRRPLPPAACAIAIAVAEGLHAAHDLRDESGRSLDVVHRDVSPQNILVASSGHVKLIDFGIAKSRSHLHETHLGSLKGKLRYMSPEQASGEAIDRRTDVFALGVVLWETLTLRRFVPAGTEFEILDHLSNPRAEPPSRFAPEVSPALDAVVLRALRADPRERFATARELRRALVKACPEALELDAEDVGAMLSAVLDEELDAQRELLRGLDMQSGDPPTLEAGGLQLALARLTRGAHEETTRVDVPHAERDAVTRVEAHAAGLDAQVAAPTPTGRPRSEAPKRAFGSAWLALPVVAALLGLGAGVMVLGEAEEPPVAASSALAASAAPAGSLGPPPLSSQRCAAVQRLALSAGQTASLELDTRGRAAPFELSGARNEEVERAPQRLVEVEVPGEGPQALSLSTVNPGTDLLFDTLLAVFRGPCEAVEEGAAPAASFDDHGREFRARGSVAVSGGDVLTVVLTGFGGQLSGRVDRGLAQLDLTAVASARPTVQAAAVVMADGEAFVRVQGADADGDVSEARLTLFDADGAPFDAVESADGRYGTHRTGESSQTMLRAHFERPVAGARQFEERATLTIAAESGADLRSARRAEVRVIDAAGRLSEPVAVDVVRGQTVGPEGECGAAQPCARELSCTRGRCVADVDRAAACRAARPIESSLGPDGVRRGSAQATIAPTAGRFRAQCLLEWTAGAEDLYVVQIPPGRWDVSLTTDSDATAGTASRHPDTVLYVRRDCLDTRPASAPHAWCNDDIRPGDGEGGNQLSSVELRGLDERQLFAFVELWGSARPDQRDERYELSVTLRAVRAEGEPCDPAGLASRCASGRCDGTDQRCVSE